MPYCTVKYNGRAKGVHPSQAKAFRMKGYELLHGKAIEVPSDIAGLMLRGVPEGAIKVVKGEPVYNAILPATAKAAMTQAAGLRRLFPVDPARALDSVETIPGEIISLGGDLENIAAGKVDTHLAPLALLGKLTGNLDVSAACARRAGVIAGRKVPASAPTIDVPPPEGAPASEK